ncbi:hypothetical protein ANO11243_070220 [Dothideomycetidae sp. 11243]|nr:hypothetical protein ANO11243_070220 [fungal sp. No.11243]
MADRHVLRAYCPGRAIVGPRQRCITTGAPDAVQSAAAQLPEVRRETRFSSRRGRSAVLEFRDTSSSVAFVLSGKSRQ